MKAGDGLVYYSPRTGMREGEPIKSFTAIGTVADGPAWQVEEQGGCFRPWRRAVEYDRAARQVPIDDLRTWLTSRSGGDPVTQRDLADHAATDPMMTSHVLRTLEQKGLLERRDHPTDRRAKSFVATESGAALVNRAIGAVETCDRAFFAPLGDRTPRFTAALRRLRDREPD